MQVNNVQVTDNMIGLLSLFAGIIILVLIFAENPGITMGTIIGIIAFAYGLYVLRAS